MEISRENDLPGLSVVDKLLPLWIFAAMVVGVVLGNFTDIADALDVAKIADVSLPIAIGLWLMMWPVLAKVRYEIIGGMFRDRRMWADMSISVFLNWIVGPALMTGLAWACLPDLPAYRNGVIMVGLARCIAMVLIWNKMAGGDPEFCAILVAINSILQIILYSPMAIFYIRVVSNQSGPVGVDMWTVTRSVLVFLGAPLAAGVATRYVVMYSKGRAWLEDKFLPFIGPVALVSLVYTVLVLFALQGESVINSIGDVARVSVPMLVYFVVVWTAVVFAMRFLKRPYATAVTHAFTSSSNNFELAIAVAVGTFGATSKEALAATVGPLVEVPVLLALVYVARWLHGRLTWNEIDNAEGSNV